VINPKFQPIIKQPYKIKVMKKMNRIAVLMFLGMILCISATAQYKVNKTKYNYKEYEWQAGERYNPAVAGIASLFVPGLGQIVSGEVGRGVGFFAGYMGGLIIYGVGVANFAEGETTGAGAVLFGAGTMLTVAIWSIVDAVRVAKVNNMAMRSTTANFKLHPAIITTPYSRKLSAGLTLQIQLN
jgi:hypothetical protein